MNKGCLGRQVTFGRSMVDQHIQKGVSPHDFNETSQPRAGFIYSSDRFSLFLKYCETHLEPIFIFTNKLTEPSLFAILFEIQIN